MSKSQYYSGKTYKEVFEKIGIKYTPDIYTKVIFQLEQEGYSESGICYALSRSEEKLLQFYGDTRFNSIIQNQVRKLSFKKNDMRWNRK